ncbi:MAG: tRNA (guanosine(18)-2'-O)-methyltransferase TrmH [Alcanivoracaceae bacterium]|nr:tRNA (guanosine(18)-2'-O)-methyltransferase TrmH [Alcanivoracaceae bacterium]
MTPERFNKIKDVLEKRQMDLTVIMDNIHKPHNFNAIVRTCDAVGVQDVQYIPVKQGYRQLNYYAKGSQKWVEAHRYDDFSAIATKLQGKGYQLLAAHFSDVAIDYRELDYTKPTAIVMGTELAGISDETANIVDEHIIVPMQGMVASLNVSVASAVILFEAQKQRLAAGMYNKRSMDDKRYEKLLFEWSYPRIARMYRDKSQPYPELDELGYFKENIGTSV